MQVREFQELIERIYLAKDTARGVDGTFRWFVEEVGELARAIRHLDFQHQDTKARSENANPNSETLNPNKGGVTTKTQRRQGKGFGESKELEGEFADVFAWLVSLASQTGINLEAAATGKYRQGCPKCRETPCACEEPGVVSS